MSEIKTKEVLDILEKLQFFQGQRAGRELWLDKPPVVQEQDLYNFNCDIEKIRSYIQSKNNSLLEIIKMLEQRLTEEAFSHDELDGDKYYLELDEAIEIVKGVMNERE